ncbi:MAG: hypothetical protein AAF899_06355 [Pseudomonadota bacterium]
MTKRSAPQAGFLSNLRGAITMEFAIWFPVLLLWLVASAVIYDAYRVRDAAIKTSYTISDILSRLTTLQDTLVDGADLGDLVELHRKMLPRGGDRQALRISSIQCVRVDGCFTDSTTYVPQINDFVVNWSVVPRQAEWPVDYTSPVALETGAAAGTTKAIPLGILPPMDELDVVLIVDLWVPFTPFTTFAGFSATTWEYRVPVRPRFVPQIALSTSETMVFVNP